MVKKKKQVDLDALEFRPLLEETVACSRLGRALASFGATLTGREKADAKLVYLLLEAGRELPKRISVTAEISEDKKSKEYSYAQAVKWFVEKYPKKAEPLLKRLRETYDFREKAVSYGVIPGKNLTDSQYIRFFVEILSIPEQDAAIMYHGLIKPHLKRLEDEKGLVRLTIK